MLKIKRVYDPPSADDGTRILIDRLWPRGLKKEDAQIDDWIRDAGPSDGLRKWFNHEPGKWDEFRKRFFAELAEKPALTADIANAAHKGTVTLLFGSREERYNNAVALKEYLESGMVASRRKKAA